MPVTRTSYTGPRLDVRLQVLDASITTSMRSSSSYSSLARVSDALIGSPSKLQNRIMLPGCAQCCFSAWLLKASNSICSGFVGASCTASRPRSHTTVTRTFGSSRGGDASVSLLSAGAACDAEGRSSSAQTPTAPQPRPLIGASSCSTAMPLAQDTIVMRDRSKGHALTLR